MLRRVMSRERPLRVMMTADAVGGVWTYALDLAAGLQHAGQAVTLVLAGPPPSGPQRRHAVAAGVALAEIDAPLDWTARDEGGLAQAASATADAAASIRPDIVHLNSPSLAAFVRFGVPTLGVCHSCLSTWWSAVKGTALPADQTWRGSATARGYAACDGLVAPSLAFARDTAALHGGALPTVIHNGRSAPPDQPEGRPEPLVLSAGRLWDEGKDIRTLDAAAERVTAPVVAVGSAEAPDGTRIGFRHLDAVGSVDAAGVAAWMARSQVFVSTARYEPFGLAVLEAAQAGLPLVLSDIPTFRELWSGAADFVSPGDAAGFAAACNRLLRDPEARRHSGATARARARTYDIADTTRSYLELYRKLTHKGAVSSVGACA